jgi:probable rRNA maturation factor
MKIKINIFTENIHKSMFVDEKKFINKAKKIFQFYLQEKNIFDSSCLACEKFKCLSFDILYCDSEKTHQINKEYRQKDYPADIITFAIFADSEEKFIFDEEINLGEIIISLDKVVESAGQKEVPFEQELYFLISHGIMHLLGFDHQSDEEYNFVVSAQNAALAEL